MKAHPEGGNHGGPGKPAPTVAQLHRAMVMTTTAEQFQAILERLYQKARAGNVEAAGLYLACMLDTPEN